MKIEPGSEWFHRDSLTPVTYLREGYTQRHMEWLSTANLRGPCGNEFPMLEETFLRDYARNEPVTLELLERMGWERLGRFWATLEGNSMQLRDCEGSASLEVIQWGQIVAVKLPATLRDLLNILRVFGVSCPIPEPVEAK